jgi:murein DD-endopeptidase MepM/ murein hydrolase activator NlpD
MLLSRQKRNTLKAQMDSSMLYRLLQKHQHTFHHVVDFDPGRDKLLQLDFTNENKTLTFDILTNTDAFTEYVEAQLGSKYKFGVGGYNEHRTIYARSLKFDTLDEPRRLHLGVDVWGPAGTPVFAPLDGVVHSFAFNDIYGDYGATIILQHQLDGVSFHTLYGHLSLADITHLQEGQHIICGTEIAHFGKPEENGYWPPHLHFQLVQDMHAKKGDYPGVCKFSEREKWLQNSPDADVILQMMQYAERK